MTPTEVHVTMTAQASYWVTVTSLTSQGCEFPHLKVKSFSSQPATKPALIIQVLYEVLTSTEVKYERNMKYAQSPKTSFYSKYIICYHQKRQKVQQTLSCRSEPLVFSCSCKASRLAAFSLLSVAHACCASFHCCWARSWLFSACSSCVSSTFSFAWPSAFWSCSCESSEDCTAILCQQHCDYFRQ